MEEKQQLFRSLGAPPVRYYLKKDQDVEYDWILWEKWYFTLLTVNTICSSIVSFEYFITHIPSLVSVVWQGLGVKKVGDFLGLSDEFFVFYYYGFNFNTSPGHETLNYKHKHYGKRGYWAQKTKLKLWT